MRCASASATDLPSVVELRRLRHGLRAALARLVVEQHRADACPGAVENVGHVTCAMLGSPAEPCPYVAAIDGRAAV